MVKKGRSKECFVINSIVGVYQISAKDFMFCEEVVIFTPQDVFSLIDKKKIPFNSWFNRPFLFGKCVFDAIEN